MTTATTSSSTRLFQDFLGKIYHSRKLLQPNQLNQQPATAALPSVSGEKNNSDSDVVMILSFLLCATICSIVLNFLINCLLSCCSSAVSSHDSGTVANTSTPIADKGIKQKALKTFTVVKYSVDSKLPGQDTECLICLFEFAPGERVRVLPKCNHGFHVPCIDEWLESHSSCPKCRSCQIETCKKIAGCSEASPSGPSQETVVTVNVVVPPEPEGMLLPNYLPLINVHI